MGLCCVSRAGFLFPERPPPWRGRGLFRSRPARRRRGPRLRRLPCSRAIAGRSADRPNRDELDIGVGRLDPGDPSPPSLQNPALSTPARNGLNGGVAKRAFGRITAYSVFTLFGPDLSSRQLSSCRSRLHLKFRRYSGSRRCSVWQAGAAEPWWLGGGRSGAGSGRSSGRAAGAAFPAARRRRPALAEKPGIDGLG